MGAGRADDPAGQAGNRPGGVKYPRGPNAIFSAPWTASIHQALSVEPRERAGRDDALSLRQVRCRAGDNHYSVPDTLCHGLSSLKGSLFRVTESADRRSAGPARS